MAAFAPSDSTNVKSTVTEVLHGSPGLTEKALTSQSQKDTAVVPLEQRCPETVLQVPYAPADR